MKNIFFLMCEKYSDTIHVDNVLVSYTKNLKTILKQWTKLQKFNFLGRYLIETHATNALTLHTFNFQINPLHISKPNLKGEVLVHWLNCSLHWIISIPLHTQIGYRRADINNVGTKCNSIEQFNLVFTDMDCPQNTCPTQTSLPNMECVITIQHWIWRVVFTRWKGRRIISRKQPLMWWTWIMSYLPKYFQNIQNSTDQRSNITVLRRFVTTNA